VAHGGKRNGSGRKRGSLTKKTREVAERAIQQGITPLEVMLCAMRHYFDAGEYANAAAFARDAAPYVHPRLSSVEVSGDAQPNVSVTVVGGIDLAAVVGQRPGLHHDHDRLGANGEPGE
jgi:hypothetical protein